MGSAPKLGLTVHHQVDHVFDIVGIERMRYLNKSKTVSPSPNEDAAGAESSPDTISYHVEQTIQDGILRIDIKEGKNIHIELPL